jgi:murein DD-endopeptidase MepM/ murein hydrolase activator NlpD
MGRRKATLVWLLCVAAVLFTATAASADEGSPPDATAASDTATMVDGTGGDGILEDEGEPIVREIVFPVVGDTSYSAGFGDCRDGCTRSHAGIDILTSGWKGLPVVAAHDGIVVATKVGGELSGCSVTLASGDGWTTHYIHLNTDRPGTDEPADACFAPGVEPGAILPAGTLLGWVGDTGNAEETTPHLHFEIRDADGVPIDPWWSLEAATRITHRWLSVRELPSLMVSLFPGPQTTVRVIDAADAVAHLFATPGVTRLEEPIVPFDAADPEPAITALEALDPERIIVLTSGTEPDYLDYLRTLAPIVATSDIDQGDAPEGGGAVAPADALEEGVPEALPEAVPSDDADAVTVHAAVASRYVVVVGGLGPGADLGLSRIAPGDIGGTPVVVANGPSGDDVGSWASGLPGSDANRDGLWWMAADGWRLTDSIDEAPSPGVALVEGRGPFAATVAYLVSTARAPQMPLWHHQPTSRASKSL